MTVARVRAPKPLVGNPRPRIAPPVPLRSDIAGLRQAATDCGIALMPWQETAGTYLEAIGPDERHLYGEVAIVVARQDGKTTLLVPLIAKRLQAGRRIVHTAQNREHPREVFGMVADVLGNDPKTKWLKRGGRIIRPRFANGQEEIRLAGGGRYRIVAPTRGGARGGSNDDVIIDELREMDDHEFIAAAKPTLTASPDPQFVYLSNAGTDESIVLNAVRDRADADPRLAYLEWSAAPDRASDDRDGWLEANPAIGHIPTMLGYLEDAYRANSLSGTMAIFETEHLCRWVKTMRELLVTPALWSLCRSERLTRGRSRTYLGVSMAPEGTRASAVVAWQADDGTIALRQVADVHGAPVNAQAFGETVRDLVKRYGVRSVGFDAMTDAEAVKYVKTSESITGGKFANASSRFVDLVASSRLAWDDADAVTDDLTWTARKENDESGAFVAVRSNDDRPVTAALASIRAAWLASGPRPSGRMRVY